MFATMIGRRGRRLARLSGVAAAGAVGLLACVTEPVCGCSEPGSRMIAYGMVTEAVSGTPVAGAEVALILGSVVTVGVAETCQVPEQRSIDDPAPVATDQSGRYRIQALSTARVRRCLILEASRDALPLVGTAEALVTFGLPGGLDSVRVDIAVRGR
ncbi:MAG: hypothetical protein ACKVZ0_22010 [Gemmatimonadales bacterium]